MQLKKRTRSIRNNIYQELFCVVEGYLAETVLNLKFNTALITI